jgi:two-component system response regulator AlgR
MAEVVGEAASVREWLAWLDSAETAAPVAASTALPARCDALLLDVQMPGPSGLVLAEALRRRAAQGQPVPVVVFVTAHAEHALKAFELDAVDYLTKPVRQDRLVQALERVARAVGRSKPASLSPTPTPTPSPAPLPSLAGSPSPSIRPEPPPSTVMPGSVDDVIIVHDRHRIVRVPVAEVLYLKAELKYVTLRTASHSWLLDESLADLEPRLAGRFVRIHRNALVALAAVRSLERHGASATVDGAIEDGSEGWAVYVPAVDEWLAVSRRQLAVVKAAVRAAQQGA